MNSITILDENDKSELNQNIDTKSPKLHTHTTDDIEGIFTVEKGGTGVSSLDANRVLYASSTSALGQMSIPTEESVLMQDTSGAPYWKPSSDVGGATKSIITLTGYSGTTYTVTNNGDENYSGTIGSSESATVKVSGLGVYTVNCTYFGKTESKTVTINNIGMYSVECYIAVFNTASYSEISTASRNGTAASIWSIGDVKAVTLNGLVGDYQFSNETVYMFIIAFDHNSSVEMNGEHHIICSFAKSAAVGGKDIAFVDSHDGYNTSAAAFHMNSSNTNSGGWKNSYMRSDICSQFKNAMPSDLQAVLRSRTIYTDNTGGSKKNSSNVTATTDYVYIPSEFEVHGYINSSNNAERNHQQQLAYYKNGASKIRYKSNNTSTATWWLMRSPASYLEEKFCFVNASGNPKYTDARAATGFAPLITI